MSSCVTARSSNTFASSSNGSCDRTSGSGCCIALLLSCQCPGVSAGCVTPNCSSFRSGRRPSRLERHTAGILQPFARAPADLSVGQPVLVDGSPFMAPDHRSHLVAVLLVVIGNFLHEAHKLWKVVAVG